MLFDQDEPITVGQLAEALQRVVGDYFDDVSVVGELSQVRPHRSGHIYCRIKDGDAVLNLKIWRTTVARLRFKLTEGLEVVVRGRLDFYAPFGELSLIGQSVEPRGAGALQLAFRQLYERLRAEGLFERDRKRSLPRVPQWVAFVTSPTGAAVRDFLKVARRRWRNGRVTVIPAVVQGDAAPASIVAGIVAANRLSPAPDVLVVGRGGGSAEDLWSFNDERVVRAIVASRIPVVSAVGHEVDTSLADLAADVRAATPSEAAELIFPSRDAAVAGAREALDRLRRALDRRLNDLRQDLALARHRLHARSPERLLAERRVAVDRLFERAAGTVERRLERDRRRLERFAASLEALSPLKTLARGYSVTQASPDGPALIDASQLSPGDRLYTRLAKGRVISRVEATEDS